MRQLRLVPAVLLAGVALAWVALTVATAQEDSGKKPISFTVVVPADAKVEINGAKTTSTGSSRVYDTPPLSVGPEYRYDLKVTSGGKTVTRQVWVRAGGKNSFDLTGDFTVTKAGGLSEADALAIATDAYVYGYPLITMEMTRRVMTNTDVPKGNHAPMGQFYNARTYPDAKFRDVTAPNADTLYSVAWLDVSKEPYVLSLPDEDGRYYLMPLLDGWTNVFQVPGKRTTGTKAQKYAITGPGWKGALPEGVTEYKSPTSLVWILGRTYCTGGLDDYKKVYAIQDKYALVPLSSYGKDYVPPKGKVDPTINMKTPVREQVNRLGAAAYFKLLAALMKDNPPAKADAPMVEKMARLGLAPGKDFDIGKLDPAVERGVRAAPKAGLEKIAAQFKTAGTKVNGWEILTKTGLYGTDYANRAFVTMIGLGANRPQDAVYPTSEADADGKPYSGANKYVMHFASKMELPPAEAFWSLTMYNADYFFVANPINRYTLSSRNQLKENADGSIDLYIQKDAPGGDQALNWLPAPKGKFVLMLRLYWPREKDPSILDGTWKPPAVKLVP
jgi:uncharacterized protein (TIGR03000 family)